VTQRGFADAGSNERFKQLSAVATAQAKSAVNDFNLFQVNVVVDDPVMLLAGKVKTWVFIAFFTLLVLALMIIYVLTPQASRGNVDKPSYAQYQSIKQWSPQCACTNSLHLGSVASIGFPPMGNASLNACKTITAIATECGVTPGCGTNDAAALFVGTVLQGSLYLCAVMSIAQETFTRNIQRTTLGADLLSESDLNDTVVHTTVTELQKLQLSTLAVSSSLITYPYSIPNIELSWGATFKTPANCTCFHGNGFNGMPRAIFNGSALCIFHAAFDWRPSPTGDYEWSCDAIGNMRTFPFELLDAPLYQMLALPPPYERFIFLSDPAKPTMYDLVNKLATYYFAQDGVNTDYTTLNANVTMNISHEAYFSACNPSSCVYTTFGTPTFASASTAALGVVGGLQSVLMIIIGIAVDRWVYRSRVKPANSTTAMREQIIKESTQKQRDDELEANGIQLDEPQQTRNGNTASGASVSNPLATANRSKPGS
jgi:hypothetical protein